LLGSFVNGEELLLGSSNVVILNKMSDEDLAVVSLKGPGTCVRSHIFHPVDLSWLDPKLGAEFIGLRALKSRDNRRCGFWECEWQPWRSYG